MKNSKKFHVPSYILPLLRSKAPFSSLKILSHRNATLSLSPMWYLHGLPHLLSALSNIALVLQPTKAASHLLCRVPGHSVFRVGSCRRAWGTRVIPLLPVYPWNLEPCLWWMFGKWPLWASQADFDWRLRVPVMWRSLCGMHPPWVGISTARSQCPNAWTPCALGHFGVGFLLMCCIIVSLD